MPTRNEFYGFREQLVDALERDLLGPSDPREVIGDPPITRYVTGILFPKDVGIVAPEEDIDSDGEQDDSGVPDPPVAMAHVRYPSSMGMTFAVDTAATRTVTIAVEAARYDQLAPEVT